MKLAFCLFKYFPYGGLQRDFLRIAREANARGHEIQIYTNEWQGEPEPNFNIHIIPVKTFQNHTKMRVFSKRVQRQLQMNSPDLVIGFNKMPYLDFYYAADVCYKARVYHQKSMFYRLLPRYRAYMALEKAVFLAGKSTQILLISPLQQKEYQQYYQTESNRFHLLPPGISRDRVAPVDVSQIRKTMRDKFQINQNDRVLLFIGSSYHTKGLDRAIKALYALPYDLKARTQLLIVGQDEPKRYADLVSLYQLQSQVHFLGARDDLPSLLFAADLLIHPARTENTGTVILEAIVAGLPVLTVDICGYAHFVLDANAGAVLASRFNQIKFNSLLENILRENNLKTWQESALAFAKSADFFSMPECAVDIIEQHGRHA